MNTRYLSKSQYTRGMQCAKSLWLYREKKELQDPVSPEQQAIFDAGTEVGILAQSWLKGGVLIKAGHDDPESAIEETWAAIEAGAKVLYEAAFVYDGVLVRVDIMAKGPGDVWDLYEVKSTTEAKDHLLLDVAIQRYVVKGAGIKLGVAHLVHLDPGYVRQGPVDLQRLFLPIDVNRDTEAMLDLIPAQLRDMKKSNAAPEPPKIDIGPRCTKPYDCSFTGHCWAHVPEYSVFNLSGARMDKKTVLWNAGHKRITDIPSCSCVTKKCTCGNRLTDYQDIQRMVAKTGKPHIHVEAIRKLLTGIGYPQSFVDFEAVNPAVPPYDGLRPYQQLPFEVSIHRRAERGAPLEHFEYLADGTRDPRRELADFLREHIDGTGPLVAYHKSYEGGILRSLGAHLGGGAAGALAEFEGRLWDLADPFRQALYAHPGFLGRWSIKAVLPVIVPDMSYDGLLIQDGAGAMQAYTKLMDPKTTEAERAAIMTALRLYCGQDTLAMVRILDHLELLVGAPAEA